MESIKRLNEVDIEWKEIIEKLKIAEGEIERGEVLDIDTVFKELKQKYEY